MGWVPNNVVLTRPFYQRCVASSRKIRNAQGRRQSEGRGIKVGPPAERDGSAGSTVNRRWVEVKMKKPRFTVTFEKTLQPVAPERRDQSIIRESADVAPR